MGDDRCVRTRRQAQPPLQPQRTGNKKYGLLEIRKRWIARNQKAPFKMTYPEGKPRRQRRQRRQENYGEQ